MITRFLLSVGVQRPERSDPWGNADGEEEFRVGLWKGWGTLNLFCSISLFKSLSEFINAKIITGVKSTGKNEKKRNIFSMKL